MTTTVEAVYQGGVFKPIRPIDLPENQRVTIVVETPNEPTSGPPKKSLKDLVGTVALTGQPTDDEEIDRLRAEALREKYVQ